MTPYWYQAYDTPLNKRFVDSYETRYKYPPAFQAQFAYGAVMAYAQAVTKAGGPQSDAVVKALEGLSLDLPMGKLTFRPEDHQAVFDVVAGKTSDKVVITRNKKPIRTLDPLVRLPSQMISVPPEMTGCKMQ